MRRLSFNPLRFGAGALPVAYFCAQSVSFLGFNPLRFGAGALPKQKGSRWRPCTTVFQSPSFRGGSTPVQASDSLDVTVPTMFQSPSFRGGSTPRGCAGVAGDSLVFQSPSFRGGSTP